MIAQTVMMKLEVRGKEIRMVLYNLDQGRLCLYNAVIMSGVSYPLGCSKTTALEGQKGHSRHE
jgi:hypothetical protein